MKVRDICVRTLRHSSAADIISFLPGLVRALADEECPKYSSLFQMLVDSAVENEEARYQLVFALGLSASDPTRGVVFLGLRDHLFVELTQRLGITTIYFFFYVCGYWYLLF